MKNIRIYICLALFVFPLFPIVYSQEIKEAELTSFSGDVQVLLKGEENYSKVEEGMKFESGDEIKVNEGASAELSFNEANTNLVRLSENSDVKVSFTEDEKLELLEGEALATISELPSGSAFEIRTPTAVSGARGTDWVTKVTEEGTDIEAMEDIPYVKHFENDGTLSRQLTRISPGQMTTVKKFARPMNFRPVSEARQQQWKELKPQVHKRAGEAMLKRQERPAFNREEFRERMKQKQKDIREGKIPDGRQKDGRGLGPLDGSSHPDGKPIDNEGLAARSKDGRGFHVLDGSLYPEGRGKPEEGERLRDRQPGFNRGGERPDFDKDRMKDRREGAKEPGMEMNQQDRFREPQYPGERRRLDAQGRDQRPGFDRRQGVPSDGVQNKEKRRKDEGFVPKERSGDKERMQDSKRGERLDKQRLGVGNREKPGSKRPFPAKRNNR